MSNAEGNGRRRWTEVACAVALSLATVASVWCAYQATLWSGVQTFRLADASIHGRKSTEATVSAVQMRSFDASMLVDYIEAVHLNNTDLASFLHARFRPEMRTAVDAWLKTNPLSDPNAPPSPFKMAEYVQREHAEVDRQDALAAAARSAAGNANQTSDRYVLLTVMFSAVLFFGGMGGTLHSRWLREGATLAAMALFTITVIALLTMPLCKD